MCNKCYIGLDPGSVRFGYAVIIEAEARFITLESGVWPVGSKRFQVNCHNKCVLVHRVVRVLMQKYETLHNMTIGGVALEDTFLGRTPARLDSLMEIRGAALSALHLSEVTEPCAVSVRAALLWDGKASKEDVALMVTKLCIGSNVSAGDESDALALALYAAHTFGETQLFRPRPKGKRGSTEHVPWRKL